MEHTKPRGGFREMKVAQIFWVVSVFLISWAILTPAVNRAPENGRRMACQANLKEIMRCVAQYSQDYDARFPLVKAAGQSFGWADTLRPYSKSERIFECPGEANSAQTDPQQPFYSDYWMNSRASGALQSQISAPARTLTFGEGNDGADASNARYHLRSIPARWRKEESPLYRHLGGANFVFADGHAKWFQAKKLELDLDSSDNSGPLFRLGDRK